MSLPDDISQTIEYAEEHIDRAIKATDVAAASRDIDSPGDIYEFVSGFEEMKTYEVTIELHEYELMQLIAGFSDGLDRAMPADELVFKSSMISKLLEACPDHYERIEAFAADAGLDEPPRGVQ